LLEINDKIRKPNKNKRITRSKTMSEEKRPMADEIEGEKLLLWADTLPTSVDNFNVDYHHYILCFDFAL